MGADDPQCPAANVRQFRAAALLKQPHQRARNDQEQQRTNGHNDHRIHQGNLDTLIHPLFQPGTEVVADDGHHAVAQAVHRHEYKGLQLEVNAQYADRSVAERHENQVEQHAHDRGNGLHDDAGEAYAKDGLNDVAIHMEAFQAQVQFVVPGLVQDEAQEHAGDLTDDRGNGGTGNAHFRATQITEDHDGVKNDVHHSAGELHHHGQHGVACGLH